MFELLELKSVKTLNVLKNQYETCFVSLEIICNLKKKSSHLDLSMQSYELLKFKLQNYVNSKV